MAVKDCLARRITRGLAREAGLRAALVGDGLRGGWYAMRLACGAIASERRNRFEPQATRARWAQQSWPRRLFKTLVGIRSVVNYRGAKPVSLKRYAGQFRQGARWWLALTARQNMSIDTDPQQQEAASPLMLVVRSFLLQGLPHFCQAEIYRD